jgi:phage-related protein
METSNKLTGEQLSLWTSSAADIPVSHLVQQENEKEQTTQDTYGHGYEQPLANYDPDTQSWRMFEGISLWEEHKLLESLPKSGMTQNGVLYQQPEWVRPIDEIASSLWPTPTTQENEHPNAT